MATDELTVKFRSPGKVHRLLLILFLGLIMFKYTEGIHHIFIEFPEFSKKQIKDYYRVFNNYDVDKSKFIDSHELQIMMEKLGAPQTFLGLKAMIKEVDEDNDNMISFREFLLIFKKGTAGELSEGSGLYQLYNLLQDT